MSKAFAIAVSEFRLALRNRWIIMAACIMTILALSLALLGSTPTGTVDASRAAITIVSLTSLAVYLVPLIALVLAYDAIIGEAERGTLLLLFTYPIGRQTLLFGKFLGHIAVLASAIVAGFGCAAVAIAVQEPLSSQDLFMGLRLLGSSILLGSVFLAVGYVCSALARDRAGAAALALGVWLVAVVAYDFGLLGMLSADIGQEIFPYLLMANPGDSFRLLNLTGFKSLELVSGIAAVNDDLPIAAFMPAVLLLAWTTLAFGLSCVLLKRREP